MLKHLFAILASLRSETFFSYLLLSGAIYTYQIPGKKVLEGTFSTPLKFKHPTTAGLLPLTALNYTYFPYYLIF